MGIKQWDIIKQTKYVIILAIILLVALNVRAEVADSSPFYLYYFETDDALLETGQTQAYQFTAFRGEKVTIVVYGLDNLIRPEITLRGEDGELAATGQSTAEQPYVRYVQFTATKDEIFTFDVTAVEAAEGGGLARVMLLEGDPIAGDLTYLDTINPLLPGRVFMVSGSDEIDRDVSQTEVGTRAGAEVLPVTRFREKPDIFVSRGSTLELPPIEERFHPDTSHVWFNEDGDKFYFFTVHAIPEQRTSATQDVEYEALNLLTFFYFDYFFIVGAGSEPVLLSQETQPCSEVTLENRVDCERLPPVQAQATDDEPQVIAVVDSIPLDPDDTIGTGTFGCNFVIDFYPPYTPPYFYPFYYYYYYEVCSSFIAIGGTASSEITGTDADDYLIAGGGDDLITALGGNDTIIGDDYSSYDCWAYNWYGYQFTYTCFPYTEYGGTGNDTIDAGDGNDTVYGGGGDDTINGGNGNDTIYGNNYRITYRCTQDYFVYYYLVYAPQDCVIFSETQSGTDADVINGDAGDDTIYAGGGNDIVNGGDDNDIIFGQGGDDTINGGDGDDTINGGIGMDTLRGDDGNDTLNGDSGNDILSGGAGNDTLNGDAGDDVFNGNTGDDILNGGDGNDTFIDTPGNNADTIDGGNGIDTADYSAFDFTLTFTITPSGTTTSIADTMSNVENYITGTDDDIFIVSGTFGNTDTTPIGISGGVGSDTVTFAAGTTGYFVLTDIETVICVPACTSSPTVGSFTQYGTNLWVQRITSSMPSPLMALSTLSDDELWDLTGEVGGNIDGGAGDDMYLLGDTSTVNVSDSGQAGIDTVIYAVNATALTIEAMDEDNFTVTDGTALVTLTGVENISTGSANDIFLLNYNPNSLSNTYDAGENAANTDTDTAVIRTDLDLTMTFTGNTAVFSQTGTSSSPDTLVNFETVETGSGDDTFVMNTAPDGLTLNGAGGLNSITYNTNADLVVDLNTTDTMTVSTGSTSDTVINFDTVTTGAGDDVVNFDVNAADSDTAYTVNAGGGFNLFNFIFNNDVPLTDTLNVTVAADGTNNVLDFSGVDTQVTIDTTSNTTQEVFTNFWLTIQGVFEVVFGTEEAEPEPIVEGVAVSAVEETTSEPDERTIVEPVVEVCPTETVETVVETGDEVAEAAPEIEAVSTPEAVSCETAIPEPMVEATDTLVEVTAEATEARIEPTAEATPETTITPEPPVEYIATPEPTAEATPTPEPTAGMTPEPPVQSTPVPESTEQS